MEMLKSWTNCILIVATMVGIIEVIVPEGETRKFVFLVTQIMVSVIIAVPIISLLKKDFELENIFNISSIEESDYYINTLRSTVNRQTEILEEVFSDNVVNDFNNNYSDMKISSCKIYFMHDENGKIKAIELVEVKLEHDIYNIELLKTRVAKLCEISKEKVRVS